MKLTMALALLASLGALAAACGSGVSAPPATPCAHGRPGVSTACVFAPSPTTAPSVVTVVVTAAPTTAATTATPAPAGASGIEGIVLVGPTCPVERVDSPCADRPVAVALAAYVGGANSSRIAGTATSGADGRFRMALAPGTYTLQRAPCDARTPGCTFPRIIPQAVVVQAGAFTSVVVHGDTGIR